MTLTYILFIIGVIFLGAVLYVSRIYLQSENEMIKMFGLCETLTELDLVCSLGRKHLFANLTRKDPFELYPRELVERYKKKYG